MRAIEGYGRRLPARPDEAGDGKATPLVEEEQVRAVVPFVRHRERSFQPDILRYEPANDLCARAEDFPFVRFLR